MKKLIFIFLLIPLISISQTFCDGWGAGYQKRLKSCMKVGLTPTCPLPNINADTYSDGYGLGYAKALEKCNEQTSQYDSSGAYQNPTYGVTDYNAFSRGFNQAFNNSYNYSVSNNSSRINNKKRKKRTKYLEKLLNRKVELRKILTNKIEEQCKNKRIAFKFIKVNDAVNKFLSKESIEPILINKKKWKLLEANIKPSKIIGKHYFIEIKYNDRIIFSSIPHFKA